MFSPFFALAGGHTFVSSSSSTDYAPSKIYTLVGKKNINLMWNKLPKNMKKIHGVAKLKKTNNNNNNSMRIFQNQL